jgi:hypothetical protein
VKFALLLSQTVGDTPTVQTRIRARVDAEPVTVQARDPPVAPLGVLEKIVLQLLPPSRDTLIWTLLVSPVPDQVISKSRADQRPLWALGRPGGLRNPSATAPH